MDAVIARSQKRLEIIELPVGKIEDGLAKCPSNRSFSCRYSLPDRQDGAAGWFSVRPRPPSCTVQICHKAPSPLWGGQCYPMLGVYIGIYSAKASRTEYHRGDLSAFRVIVILHHRRLSCYFCLLASTPPCRRQKPGKDATETRNRRKITA